MTVKPSEIRAALANHCGTSAYHQCFRGLDGPVLTDGALEMAQLCQAFWLIDLIVLAQRDTSVGRELFQVWKLTLNGYNSSGALTCTDGNDNPLTKQELAYTDFPLPEGVTLWKEGEVILLPSEH
jgi:hypothetical protein